MSNYPGIDYAGPGSTVNRDASTGIRYGVISQNSIQPDVMSDIWSEARNLSYEAAVAEKQLEIERAVDTGEDAEESLKGVLDFVPSRDQEATIDEILGEVTPESRWECVEQYFNDRYESGDSHDWLWEKDGYELSNCLQSDVFVSKSPYFTYAQFCSPCVPGAGNLDHPYEPQGKSKEQIETVKKVAPLALGEAIKSWAEHDGWPRVFCLGHDFFDNEEAPYPVFSVKTGNRVVMKTQWKSVAKWPDGVGINLGNTSNISEDIHGDAASAQTVCDLLVKNGFGGDGKVFPVWTQVREEKVEVEQ